MSTQNYNSLQNSMRQWAMATKNQLQRPVLPTLNISLVPSRYTIDIKLKGERLLLFNSVTRSLCCLNQTETQWWLSWRDKGSVDVSKEPAFVRSLANDGYIVDSVRDELTEAKTTYFNTRQNRDSMMLTIAPTMACNLACGYCFQGLNKNLEKFDRRVSDAVMTFIEKQTGTLRNLSITWYGGEPLMAKKDIFGLADRMISHCDMQGIQYSSMIVTNGYFLTVDVARQLWSRRCTSAQVTIDGVEATHDAMRPLTSGRGSFKKIIDNITAVLQETPLRISLRVNVGHTNVAECEQLLDEFVERGFAQNNQFQLYFAPIDAATSESGTAFEDGLTRMDFNAAVLAVGERARALGLSAPLEAPRGIMGMCVAAMDNGYVVTHKGDVHKCWETAHDPDKRIGTIFEPDALSENLHGQLWQQWSPFESEVCQSCKILPMCGGFCGHRYIYYGAGNDQALPCPEWKWNTAEYVFARAKDKRVVTDDDWLEQEATVHAKQSGERHSVASLRKAQASVFKKVGAVRGEVIDVNNVVHGGMIPLVDVLAEKAN